MSEVKMQHSSWTGQDGSVHDAYYLNDKPHRDHGPADTIRFPFGITLRSYFRNGVRHRDHGPAIVMQFPGGGVMEQYFRDGELVENPKRPAPKAPNTSPGAPGPA